MKSPRHVLIFGVATPDQGPDTVGSAATENDEAARLVWGVRNPSGRLRSQADVSVRQTIAGRTDASAYTHEGKRRELPN